MITSISSGISQSSTAAIGYSKTAMIPGNRGFADLEHHAGDLRAAIVPIVEQDGCHHVEQSPFTPAPTLEILTAKVVLDPMLQLKGLLIRQTYRSLDLQRSPRILVNPHKLRRCRKVAVAHAVTHHSIVTF
jgi:hypothetical protein